MSETRRGRTSRRMKVPPPLTVHGIAENLYLLQQDLEVASRIQKRLLPAVPEIPGYEFGVWYQPAGQVGGDFYDFMPGDDDSVGFLVADASGKGLAGALLMVEARAMIRAMASMSASPREILSLVNRVLLHDLERGTFVTSLLAVLDPRERTLTVASAGHMPMLLWRAATGAVESVQPRGLVLGAAGDGAFDQAIGEETIRLEPGDRFLLYTDGVTELMNPVRDEFGPERLLRWMRVYAHLPSRDAVRNLADILEAHRAGQEQSDDITFLTGRVLPAK